jgi:hypothetical protein
MFVMRRHVLAGSQSFLEEAINLAQFPEDQNKENRDYEEQELNIHLVALWLPGNCKGSGIVPLSVKLWERSVTGDFECNR